MSEFILLENDDEDRQTIYVARRFIDDARVYPHPDGQSWCVAISTPTDAFVVERPTREDALAFAESCLAPRRTRLDDVFDLFDQVVLRMKSALPGKEATGLGHTAQAIAIRLRAVGRVQ